MPLPLIGGLVFLLFFYWAYSNLENDFYQVRDDGVITMSHAKNLVEHGFIGIAPSGERVEGYSAPLQFFLYAILYTITGINYDTYAYAQTAIFTFLLGAIFILFFRESRIYAFVFALLAGFLLSHHTSFLQWHGSGMENAVTHVLFLSTVFLLYSSAKTETITYPFAIIVFLASISRIDSAYHIAPLLMIFSVFWLFTCKNFRGMYFSFLAFGLWVTFQLWRYIYFGDLFPNTSYAQGISVSERLHNWAHWNQSYLNESIYLAKTIFSYHAGYLVLATSPLLMLVQRDNSTLLLFMLIESLILTACFHPFLFGPTRLDYTRSTTHLTLFAVLGIATILYFIENKRHLLWITPTIVIAGSIVFSFNYVAPYYMCCEVRGFDSTRKEFVIFSSQQALPRPTISNPDLGVMSWHKQFNIVDLGMLGSPTMAKLHHGSILADYFFDYAAPDLIESHYYWTCRYKDSLFRDFRFRTMYQPVYENLTKGDGSCGGEELLSGIWVRKDILKSAQTAERQLIDDLRDNLSPDRLRQELEVCQSQPQSRCAYVSRTAFRFLPEFRDKNHIDELNEIFSSSRTKPFDLYLINGYRDGQAHVSAIEFIASRSQKNQLTAGPQ